MNNIFTFELLSDKINTSLLYLSLADIFNIFKIMEIEIIIHGPTLLFLILVHKLRLCASNEIHTYLKFKAKMIL